MGRKLLERSVRGVCPTRAGEILYREATELLRQLDQLSSLVRSSGGIAQGSVRLGLSSILGAQLAAKIVAACKESLPGVELKLVASDSATLRERVEAQTLDAAILFESQAATPALKRYSLFRQRLYYVSGQQPEGRSAAVSLAELAEQPLIMPSHPHVTRVLLDQSFHGAGLSARTLTEVDGLSSILAAVRMGMGGTVVMAGNLADLGAADMPAPIPIEPSLEVVASIVSRAGVPLTPAAEAVHEILTPLVMKHLASSPQPGSTWIGHDRRQLKSARRATPMRQRVQPSRPRPRAPTPWVCSHAVR